MNKVFKTAMKIIATATESNFLRKAATITACLAVTAIFLSKLPPIYVGGNQPEKLPAYDNIHRMQFKDFSDKWRTDLYPRELDKWIKPYKGAGTIESTIIYLSNRHQCGGSDSRLIGNIRVLKL